MKKTFKFIVFIMITILILSACGSKEEHNNKNTVAIKDAFGTEHITKNPKRVVVLEYTFIDHLAALGKTPVGIADEGSDKNITKPVRDKLGKYESVGTREQPNLEKISQLKPDLIIADESRHKKIRKDLKKIAPTLMLVSGAGDYDDNMKSFKTVSKALNKEKEGQKRLEKHDKILAEAKKKIKHSHLKSAFAFGVSHKGMFINTEETFMGEFLNKMGVKAELPKSKTDHIGKQKDGPYKYLNNEELADIDPKVMIVASNGKTDKNRTTFIDPKVWKSLQAVKDNKVYDVDRNKWMQFRGVISSESMAHDLEKIAKESK